MPRYAFKLQIKAGAIEEYEREHQRVWPELLATLKEVGISDYSIFRRGQELISACAWKTSRKPGTNWIATRSTSAGRNS